MQIQIVLLSFASLICKTEAGGGSLIYHEQLLRADQLCPDLENFPSTEDILPNKSLFGLARHYSNSKSSDLCFFESKESFKRQTTVLIKAFHVDYSQWDYTGAQACPQLIKLELPKLRVRQKFPLPVCNVSKARNTLIEIRSDLYHPYVWQLPTGKMGISFSTLTDSRGESLPTVDEISHYVFRIPKEFPDVKLDKYEFVQIVFATFLGEKCSLRVQQYLIDPLKDHCKSGFERFYTLCGMYNCSEEETILHRVGFWDESQTILENQKLIEFERTKYFVIIKSAVDQPPVEPMLLVGFLLFLIFPAVSLIVYCVTRQLKERLATRKIIQRCETILDKHNGAKSLWIDYDYTTKDEGKEYQSKVQFTNKG